MKAYLNLVKVAFLLFAMNLQTLCAQDSLAQQKHFNYQIGLNGSGRILSGTFNQRVFSIGLDVKLNWERWELHNTASYRYNNFNGAQIEDNWYQLFKFSYVPQKQKIYPVVFYLFDNNLLFRVNQRHMAGAGAEWVQDKWKQSHVRLDLGFGYESTTYDGTEFENTSSKESLREKPLFLLYLQHKHHFLNKKIHLTNTLVYRQSLIEQADYYLLIRPGLSLNLFKKMAISLSYEYRFEHIYLIGLSGTNTVLLAGLNYSIAGGGN